MSMETVIAAVAMHGEQADADRRAMMESPGEVIRGLCCAMKAMGASRGVVVIPRNRTDLYRRIRQAIDAEEINGEINGACPYLRRGAVRVERGAEPTGDCPQLNAGVLVEIARSVERALAGGELKKPDAEPRVSPIGANYDWIVQQSGGGVHAPYAVMVRQTETS